ncbi:uncharacterized protein LOC126374328 [Pectinophora gossypiella]|uniref:uncharacterized protein LOC126374328 n=1 Tax=Pectinophora gossypiella TaxID=13191 RepID=UPI00214EDDBF|nr:uncharacterized protein LOC126374328 [Pectinophora gossypiella]XP_049876855.1 uncharacterized protein LOC126374328 [Pectinophora gossypiella]
MEGELNTLIRQRSSIKARITIFHKYVDSIKLIETSKLDKVMLSELQLKLSRFQELFVKFDDIQSKIEIYATNIEEQMLERDKIEDCFCKLISLAQNICDQYNVVEEVRHPRSESGHGSCHSSNNNCNIKLPTIKLPTFDGNYLKWLEFHDSFDTLINKNDSVPNINKFHYLRSSLEGAAAVVIKSIEFTANNYNYKSAWNLLCERFNNKRILTNNHIKCLFNFDPITKESYKSLRYMIDYYSKNLSALEQLEEPTEHWDTLIIFMMASKLDSATARKWEEHKSNLEKSPTLKEFIKFLRSRADVLETMQYNHNSGAARNEKQRFTKSFVALFGDNTNYKECIICKQSHLLYQCTIFKEMSLEDRLAHVSKFNLCKNCLRTGHRPAQCRLGPCRFCKKKHNSLLHKSKTNTNKYRLSHLPVASAVASHVAGAAAAVPPSPAVAESSSPAAAVSPSSSLSLSAATPGQVLLCTAEVELVDLKSNNTYPAKVLLDSGSQSSFITEKMQNIMNLDSNNVRPMPVSGINNSKTSVNKVCNLRIKSKVNSFHIDLSCLVIPQITNQLPNVEIDPSRLNIPNNVLLADPGFFRPSEIHVLLGADAFWEVVESQQIRLGRNKPTLQQSMFGWLVAGPTSVNPTVTNCHVQCYFSRDIPKSFPKLWKSKDGFSSSSKVYKKRF